MYMLWIKQTYQLDISIVSLLFDTRRFGAGYARVIKWGINLFFCVPYTGVWISCTQC